MTAILHPRSGSPADDDHARVTVRYADDIGPLAIDAYLLKVGDRILAELPGDAEGRRRAYRLADAMNAPDDVVYLPPTDGLSLEHASRVMRRGGTCEETRLRARATLRTATLLGELCALSSSR